MRVVLGLISESIVFFYEGLFLLFSVFCDEVDICNILFSFLPELACAEESQLQKPDILVGEELRAEAAGA